MTAVAGDIPDYPALSAKRDRVMLSATQPITGGAGAVGPLVSDDPGITIAKNAGAGTYDITFPKAIAAKIYAQLLSPAGTVKIAQLSALNAAAGTAQLVCSAPGGAATNPAAADEIHLLFLLDQRSD